MPQQLIITIPANDPDLRREIEQGVEEYADVRQSPSYSDLETVKLVLDVVGQSIAIAGGVAGILTFIRSLKQEKEQQGLTINITVAVPGGPVLTVDDDPTLQARLLNEEPRA